MTKGSMISSGYMEYRSKEKVVQLGNEIMSLSKTISKLPSQTFFLSKAKSEKPKKNNKENAEIKNLFLKRKL